MTRIVRKSPAVILGALIATAYVSSLAAVA